MRTRDHTVRLSDRSRRSPAALIRRTMLPVAGVAAISGALMASPAGAAQSASATGTELQATSSPYGTVVEIENGPFAGFTVYAFDRNTASACTTTQVTVGGQALSCAGPETDKSADWPVVTTIGKPIAGPGINKHLLGMVHRRDIKADQVTYGGKLLYLFDMQPHQYTGVNFLETSLPLPPWRGLWYAVSAKNGAFATGPMTLTTQAQSSGGTVLDVEMFQGVGVTNFVIYSSKHDTKNHSNCTGSCALTWPPVLSSSTVSVTTGLNQKDVGTITRADGTHQITYKGHPLYFYDQEVPHVNPSNGQPLNPATTGSGNGVGGFTLVSIG